MRGVHDFQMSESDWLRTVKKTRLWFTSDTRKDLSSKRKQKSKVERSLKKESD